METKQSFFDFYTSGVSLKKLEEGEHTAQLVENVFVPANEETKTNPYVRLAFKLEDRTIVDNRFETGFMVFLDQIKQQLGISDKSMPVPELLNLLKSCPIKIYVKYNTVDNKTYRNINFIPFKSEEEEDEVVF